MSKKPKLVLEILSGPLDGLTIHLEENTEWSRIGEGPLIFPWDDELGEPQARFTVEEGGWWLESLDAPHGTYYLKHGEKIKEKVQLEPSDILIASNTWLLILSAN